MCCGQCNRPFPVGFGPLPIPLAMLWDASTSISYITRGRTANEEERWSQYARKDSKLLYELAGKGAIGCAVVIRGAAGAAELCPVYGL